MLFSPNSSTPGTGKIPQACSIIIQQAGLIQAIFLQGPVQHEVGKKKNTLFTEFKVNSISSEWVGFLSVFKLKKKS